MKLRYIIGALVGAVFGTGLGYVSAGQDFDDTSLWIGALIGMAVGLFLVASASASAGASSDSGGFTGGG
jgi:hypothetical protein